MVFNEEFGRSEVSSQSCGDSIRYCVTEDGSYFLSIDKFRNPFACKLKVNQEELGNVQEVTVDLVETFNYLLGLKVKKLKARKNNGVKYIFVLGEKEGKLVAVVWREYKETWTDEDFLKDQEFIVKELTLWNPQVIYINGLYNLPPKLNESLVEVRSIEPEFKKLMENG